MPDTDKSYLAGFRFGEISDTQDITGKILSVSDKAVSRGELEAVIPKFTGRIMQLPPMYSAVQVGGKRLYDLARQGIEVERTPRETEIKSLRITEYSAEIREGTMEVHCGKGTYIRTIIHDIGEKLGCGGIMTSLIRTGSGGFNCNDCYTLEEIQKARDDGRIEELIIPVERIFDSLPKLRLNPVQTRMYRCGVKLDTNRINNIRPNADRYSVYSADKCFIGTAVIDRDAGELRVEKNFN